MKTIKSIILTCALTVACAGHAVDFTNKMTEIKKSGHWQVVEFAGANQLMYRLATTSINNNNINLVFDFLPSKDCLPSPAVMIIEFDSYKKVFDEGLTLMEYKLPREKGQTIELIKTVMSEGDKFAFFPFEKLTAKRVSQANDKGKLAIWVPKGYEVKRSENMYFSLDGFTLAYKEAKKLCSDNMTQ
jgi:hypothetical protein